MHRRGQGVVASETPHEVRYYRAVLVGRRYTAHEAAVVAWPLDSFAVARWDVDADVLLGVTEGVHGLTAVFDDAQLAAQEVPEQDDAAVGFTELFFVAVDDVAL